MIKIVKVPVTSSEALKHFAFDYYFTDIEFIFTEKQKLYIYQSKNNTDFVLEFSGIFDQQHFDQLLKTSFKSLLNYENEEPNYTVYLPHKVKIANELFDDFIPYVEISKLNNSGYININFTTEITIQSSKWSKWSPQYIFEVLKSSNLLNEFKGTITNPSKETFNITFKYHEDEVIEQAISDTFTILRNVESLLYKKINSVIWNKEYEENEEKFTKDILLPLFRKMGFFEVVYNHGTGEFGKDIIFAERTKFNSTIYYGVQAKAGNVSEKTQIKIDKIIEQINDAFTIPFKLLTDKADYHISLMIIVISGRFSDYAKNKIRQKINKGLHGCVFFWDQDKILELIEIYWQKIDFS